MKRAHTMPFGAEVLDAARTRFRLWAPGAKSVELVLSAATPRIIDMPDVGGGWRELLVEAPAGTRYHYRVDGKLEVPDPASRFQPDGVHGPSTVVDPRAFDWTDGDWRGRPWAEAVIYELHVGTFHPEGHLRRRRSPARPPGGARRHGHRADAAWRTSRAGATGATTACCLSRPTRPTARPTT